jgi:hypothetical protein
LLIALYVCQGEVGQVVVTPVCDGDQVLKTYIILRNVMATKEACRAVTLEQGVDLRRAFDALDLLSRKVGLAVMPGAESFPCFRAAKGMTTFAAVVDHTNLAAGAEPSGFPFIRTLQNFPDSIDFSGNSLSPT